MRTLVLDSTYFPVKIVGWQKAMILLITGRAEIVTEYEDNIIRTVSQSFQLPKILRLNNKHKAQKKVKFTRMNVFWRDAFKCQYCLTQLPASSLTFDHVIPSSKGGDTSWENVVTCCPGCNTKKGDKPLDSTGMKLYKKPIQPDWSPQLCLRLKIDDPAEWYDWLPGSKTLSMAI
ncbi:MAG: HNH endonuclease [Halobacteriovorax sp.]|nr:HNH endonuclease [Halobacteriovorax sp.]|tara:strand:+ start:15543 stop:16067 length:525 start_codon:yes stop_codon:yes gene_type:complete